MAFVANRGNSITQTPSAACAPVTCPVCGGLECLCRPRFFAGQLLTDEDLQRLDHYITAKNKLHNRYLIGWGVACGLEVVCNWCDGTVTVRPGYALSPCGEDIVVCADAPVDVCSMIQKCRKQMPRNCQPPQAGAPDPCSDTTEDWILSICYNETTSRGVVPLKNTGTAACCSRCSCGGSSSCGCRGQSSSSSCGCRGQSSSSSSSGNGCSCSGSKTTQTASGKTQCEPTIVCEGYTFSVCKAPTTEPRPQLGAIVQRFWCCLLKLGELFAQFPTSGNQQDVNAWCCAIRDNLLQFTADNPGYDCGLAQRIANMCTATDPQQIGNDVGQLVLEYLQYCFCSALLPPCPAPAADDCVPIATITVSKKNGTCTIQRVCNIDARKFLVDMPNLGYWLSWIPFGAGLRELFSTICCTAFEWEKTAFQPGARAIGVESARSVRADTVAARQPASDFVSLLTATAANSDRKVDLQALTMAVLGMNDEQHRMTDLELTYPFESVMLNQVGRPFVQSYLTGGLTAAVGAQASGQASTRAEIAALKTAMDGMKKDLKKSQDQIEQLKKSSRG